jgi:hypothetical protein
MSDMRRREFITLLGGAAAAWPLAARAQQSAKMPTIGYLGGGGPTGQRAWVDAFVQRLRELGWIEGRTVAIEYRWGEGRADRYAEIAAEFVRLKVDVIQTEPSQRLRQSRRHRSSRSSSPWRETRSEADWSLPWRDRAAMSPASQTWEAAWLLNASNSCVRLSQTCVGWPSWPMSTIPAA